MTDLRELRFDGEVAVITGAGGSLGAAYTEALAARGAQVVLNDLVPGPAGELADRITASGGTAIADHHDIVTDADRVIAAAVDRFGRVDILVNNAGVWDAAPIDGDAKIFQRTIDTHLAGSLAMVRAAWPYLKTTGGRLVQTSSGGIFGGSLSVSYPTAKSALFGSVLALRQSAQENGITVNGILPTAYSPLMEQAMAEGPYKERMKRMKAADVAQFLLLLCHRKVPFHGECFATMAGHVSRVVFGFNNGVSASSPEEYLTRAIEISDISQLSTSSTAREFLDWTLDRVEAAPA